MTLRFKSIYQSIEFKTSLIDGCLVRRRIADQINVAIVRYTKQWLLDWIVIHRSRTLKEDYSNNKLTVCIDSQTEWLIEIQLEFRRLSMRELLVDTRFNTKQKPGTSLCWARF